MKKAVKKTRRKKAPVKHSSVAPKSEIVSNRIEEFRLEKEWSQAELAERANMNPGHLCKIESGSRKQVSLPVAMRISKALGKTVEETFQCD